MTQVWQEKGPMIGAIIMTYSMKLIGAILILILGWAVAGWIQKRVHALLGKSDKCDETLQSFFANLARYLVLIFTMVAVLNQFGIQTASLIAILGAAGLAIGLALQGTLSNIAAGVMLLIFRPFKVGDYVDVAGIAGTVKSITLFVTELATPDNVQILAPNSQVWGTSVRNFSFHTTRRVDLAVGIDYKDNIDQAMRSILEEVETDTRALKEPAPMVAVVNLGDNAVDLTIRIWCQAGDYWPLKFDMTKRIKQRLDQDGISIPFPQTTVHLNQMTV